MSVVLKSLERAVLALGWIARACVLVLVLLVACNVLLRYVFSWSPVGLQELEWHLISPIALLGMAYAVHHRADVRVDFLHEHMSRRAQALVDLLGAVLTLVVGILIAWLSWPYVMQSYAMGEGSPDPGGLPYRFALKAFLVLGFAALALQGLLDAVRTAMRLSQEGAPA